MKTNRILKVSSSIVLSGVLISNFGCKPNEKKHKVRPNILILMSDNQAWNHVGCYGDSVVKTPAIDGLAEKGIRFNNAFCSSPSSAPARASMLTGQDIWRLEEAANLWSGFPQKFELFTHLLEDAGYLVGHEGKGWGPGNYEASGRTKNPAGNQYNTFEEFYDEKGRGQPWCYWFSSRNPHRPFKVDAWKKGKINLDSINIPPYLPNSDEVRKDIGDYYAVIQNFDKEVSSFLQTVREMGQAGFDNTIIIVCSDNGWQMPHGLATLYDGGTHVPLVIYAPKFFKGGRVIDDFVSLNDFAPTFLELAGIDIPKEMNAKSLVNILKSEEEGNIEKDRDYIVTARERHAYVRKNGDGYPSRALRTKDFLFIHNYEPDRWPAGDPPLYGDVDAFNLSFPCPTKMYMLVNRDKEGVKNLFNLSFGKRPADELYDLAKDPYQMNNVAALPAYKEVLDFLSDKLNKKKKKNADPRVTGGEMKWEGAKYFAEKDFVVTPSEDARKLLNLKEEYSYIDSE